jgi:membrane protease YdiL (CAAX protease family)
MSSLPARIRYARLQRVEFAAVALATVVYPILFAFGVPSVGDRSVWRMAIQIPWRAGIATILLLLLARDPVRPLKRAEAEPRLVHQVGFGIILMIGIWILDIMTRDLLKAAGVPGGFSGRASSFADPSVAAFYPVATFFVAVYEEVVYRVYLLTRLVPWVGDIWAVLISAACFAAMHGYSPVETGVVFGAGLLYAVGYLGTRSIPTVVTAHWSHNILVLLVARGWVRI